MLGYNKFILAVYSVLMIYYGIADVLWGYSRRGMEDFL